MKTIFKIISTGILILMLATLVVPAGYLAWRAGQPMELPQFNGLTYYQYMGWRKVALHQMAVAYQASHPNAKMGGGLDMCYRVDLTGHLGLVMPVTGFYTLASIYPNFQKLIPSDGREIMPLNVTAWNFLPSWWQTFEKFIWKTAQHDPHTSVAYCRLQASIPTPEEYESMRSEMTQTVVNP